MKGESKIAGRAGVPTPPTLRVVALFIQPFIREIELNNSVNPYEVTPDDKGALG
jgi:hypothetical protein